MMNAQRCGENPTLPDKYGAFYTGTKNFSHPAFVKDADSRERQKVVQAADNENRRSQDPETQSCY